MNYSNAKAGCVCCIPKRVFEKERQTKAIFSSFVVHHLLFIRKCYRVDFIPCICRTPSAEKSVTLVDRSAIDADLSARALEELLGRTHKGAATNRFSALPLALAVFDCSVCLCHNFVEVFNLI